MTSVQPVDGGAVTLPASMQTLLDRCTEREVTAQERHTLAHASPNVRCEALRIFFEMNDAAAAVEYVLTHGATAGSPRSHTSTSGGHRSSRSSSTAVVAAAATATKKNAAVVAHPRSALQPLSTNVLSTKPTAATEPRTSAEEGWRSTVAVVALAQGPTAPSPLAKAGSRPRRATAARGESVCTLVTVSSMSSSSDGDDSDGDDRHRAGDSGIDGEEADMPPTVTLRTRASHASTSTTASAVPVVPALALDAVLKQRNSHSSCSISSPNLSGATSATAGAAATVAVKCRKSVSPALSIATTTAAAPAHDRAVSPSVMPPPGARRLPSPAEEAPTRHGARPQKAKKASPPTSTAAARRASPTPVPPVDPAKYMKTVAPAVATAPLGAADDAAEEAPRKTVAAKPAHTYTDPARPRDTAATAASAAVAATPHHVAFTDATAMDVLDEYRRHAAAATAAARQGCEVELAYTELSGRHSSPSPSCVPPSCGAGTDWAALVAAVRPPPPLPAHEVLAAAATAATGAGRGSGSVGCGGAARPSGGGATAEPASAVSSPRTARRTAPAKTPTPAKSAPRTARPTSASGPGSPRSSSTKAPRTPRVSDMAKPPMAASSTTRDRNATPAAAPAHLPPRTPRVSFEDGSTRRTGSGGVSGIARMSPRGSQQSSTGGGASPDKRGVAWDAATGTYITHPNQLRRQLSRNALVMDAPASARATAAAAAGPAASAKPAAPAAARSVAVCAAGASALETPSTLRYYFSRTASTAASADHAATAAANSKPAQGSPAFARTPTAVVSAGGAAAAGFGRLCSSAAHLSSGSAAGAPSSGKAAAPAAAKAAAKFPSSGSYAKSEPTARRAAALNTPRSARGAAAGSSKKPGTAARALAPPPVIVPIKPSPRVMEYQRLRSGFAMPAANVYCHGGEVIALQRQASHLHALQQAIVASPDASPNKLHRTATAAAAAGSAVRLERHYSMMHGGGVEVVEVEAASPPHQRTPPASALRTPRTARPLAASHLPPPSRESDDTSRMSARRHGGTLGDGAGDALGPVPAAQCGVFERLASNYYAVYSSATALQAVSSPPPVTAWPRTGRRGQQSAGHRRNASAPAAGSRGRRPPPQRAAAAPAFRDAWLNPREMDGEAEMEVRQPCGKAPAPAAFARSNTSRYLTF